MRKFIIIFLASAFVLSCNNKSAKITSPSEPSVCYTGKLVKKGICAHYVVQMLSPAVSEVKMESAWRDSFASKDYKNVFTVANPCQFPDAISENEEFLFEITANTQQDCIRCEAYTPVPQTSNFILVCRK